MNVLTMQSPSFDLKDPNGMVVFVCLFVFKKACCVSVAGFRSTRLLPIHLW